MQTVGAQWFLVERHASATTVALVQTATLLPTLILAIFAGALADRVDRRQLQDFGTRRLDSGEVGGWPVAATQARSSAARSVALRTPR